eukprot:TRINITY_DN9418_c1_g1_i1.p1 TRINITY_DN9418_c1_g1~~TRINITY_DN9418_c1_g1_i1.p1  ORF type:complete len:1144 (+),score=435.45 TRINITY_DN9418_c1_g1_i1:202-3633(+)
MSVSHKSSSSGKHVGNPVEVVVRVHPTSSVSSSASASTGTSGAGSGSRGDDASIVIDDSKGVRLNVSGKAVSFEGSPDAFHFGFVYGLDTTMKDVYERSIQQKLSYRFIKERQNTCLLVLGTQDSEKSTAMDDILVSIASDLCSYRGASSSRRMRILGSFYALSSERVRDLLRRKKEKVVTIDDDPKQCGSIFSGGSSVVIRSGEDVRSLLREVRTDMETHATTDELAKTHFAVMFRVLNVRFLVVEVGTLDSLTHDPTTLRIREGYERNQSLVHLARVIEKMAVLSAEWIGHGVHDGRRQSRLSRMEGVDSFDGEDDDDESMVDDLGDGEDIERGSVEGMDDEDDVIGRKKTMSTMSAASSSSQGNAFPNFHHAKLTHLLSDALGGNCHTSVIAVLPSFAPTPKARKSCEIVLHLAHQMQSIVCFPLRMEGNVPNLLRRYFTEIKALRSVSQAWKASSSGGGGGSAATSGSAGVDSGKQKQSLSSSSAIEGQKKETATPREDAGTAFSRIHDLEGKIVRLNLEKVKLQEEKDRVLEKLVGLKNAYEKLVESKSRVSEDLLKSEEEKLVLSKAIVDFKIRNAHMTQEMDSEKFEVVNKLLVIESLNSELEEKVRAKDEEMEKLRLELKECHEELDALKVEFVALKTNFINVSQDLEAERKKGEEVGLELIGLASERKKWVEEREKMMQGRDLTEKERKELNESMDRYERELSEAREAREKLREEMIRKEMEWSARLIKAEERTLQEREEAVKVSKTVDDQVREKETEFLAEKRLLQAQIISLRKENQSMKRERMRMTRQVEELGASQKSTEKKNRELEEDLKEARARIANMHQHYRLKLDEFTTQLVSLKTHGSTTQDNGIASVGDGDGVEVGGEVGAQEMSRDIVKEMILLHESREEELRTENQSLRERVHKLYGKNAVLVDAYRKLRYLVEDYAMENGDDVPLVSETELDSLSDMKDFEREQEMRVIAMEKRVVDMERATEIAKKREIETLERHEHVVFVLKEENAKLMSEISSLRREHDTHQMKSEMEEGRFKALEDREIADLRRENEELRAKVRDGIRMEGKKGLQRDEDRVTIERLQAENSQLRESMSVDGDRKLLLMKKMNQDRQQQLEKKVLEWKNRALMAEEQLTALQKYIAENR